MKRLAEFYLGLTLQKRALFIHLAIGILIAIILIPFFLLSLPGLSLGFLAGVVIQAVCYISLLYSAKLMLEPNALSKKKALLAIPLFLLRYILYAGILLLAGFATFYWGSTWLNFWAVLAGLLIIYPVLLIVYLAGKKKGESPLSFGKKEEVSSKEEEDKEVNK